MRGQQRTPAFHHFNDVDWVLFPRSWLDLRLDFGGDLLEIGARQQLNCPSGLRPRERTYETVDRVMRAFLKTRKLTKEEAYLVRRELSDFINQLIYGPGKPPDQQQTEWRYRTFKNCIRVPILEYG